MGVDAREQGTDGYCCKICAQSQTENSKHFRQSNDFINTLAKETFWEMCGVDLFSQNKKKNV